MTLHSQSLPITVDPLIEEANRRKRRRRLLLTAALAGVFVLAIGLTIEFRPAGQATGVSYAGGWVPQGVQGIDVHTLTLLRSGKPALPALRITEPSKVNQIIGWFDALVTDHVYGMCQGSAVANMTFTFRSANGRALATANSNPYGASRCSPTYFTAGTHSISLADPSTVGRDDTFIDRVARLLGVKFPMSPIEG